MVRVAGLALGVAVLGAVAPLAHADATTASSVVIDGKLDASGQLTVMQTITFAGSSPATLTQQLATTQNLVHAQQMHYTVSDVQATIGGQSVAATVADDSNATTISVNTAQAGPKPIVVSYKVMGATMKRASDVVLSWPVLQGLSVGVTNVSGTIVAPGHTSFVQCLSGPATVLNPCSTVGAGTFESPNPTFSDGPRAANDQVVLSFGVPASATAATAQVKQLWTLDRAFSVNSKTLWASLIPLLLGGLALLLLHRRAGRDIAAQDGGGVTPVAAWTPVGAGHSQFTVLDGVRPGEVGTLMDERVDPVDITATLLDLSVRGYLLIRELPRASAHAPLDWTFERRRDGADLLAYERTIFDAVAPEVGESVPVSQVGPAIHGTVAEVQSNLYDEVVRRGWFAQRPDGTRDRWSFYGWLAVILAVVATGLLIAFTSYAMVGLVLVALALGLVLVGQRMPRRTASGSGVRAGLAALAAQLQVQSTDQAQPGQEYHEPARVLPYAVVLGGAHRWLQAIADADDDPGVPDPEDLDWYHAPATWNLSDLPASIEAFIVTMHGRLYGR